MNLNQMIAARMSSELLHFYNGEEQLVSSAEIKNEYQILVQYLDQNFEHQKDIIAIKAQKDYHYFLLILACLEVGIPYIPMMKDYPEERVRQIKEDSNFTELIDDEAIKRILSTTLLSQVRRNAVPLDSQIAYAIFTSGSSGKPKGVAISRAALTNFIKSMDQIFSHLNSSDHLLQISEFSFDLSVSDVAVFIAKNTHMHFTQFKNNFYNLAFEIESLGISVISTVPHNLSMLLSDQIYQIADFSLLKTFIICGARFTDGLYVNSKNKISAANVYNFYGPTECTVFSHVNKLTFDPLLDKIETNVLVGTPIPGVEAIIYSDGRKAKPNEKGEVYLGGVQVLSHYMNDPEKTASVMKRVDGKTYYATGDLGFIDHNNNFYIVGRMDDTIKSRGFRINLLDIDSYILRLPYVEDCATIALAHEDFENQILAIIKLKEVVSTEQIKKDLLNLIPSYQIPEKIVFVDSYPTNSSGKVCKKSLKSSYLANRSSL